MSAAETKETRRHRRFNVDVEVSIHTPTGRKLVARTRDVSRSGICLITTTTLVGGTPVVIEMFLAFGDNVFSEPLRLNAHVVWCTAIGQSFQVGAMFDSLSEEQDGFLEMFLHFLDGTLAPKGVDPIGADDDTAELQEDESHPDIKDDPFRR